MASVKGPSVLHFLEWDEFSLIYHGNGDPLPLPLAGEGRGGDASVKLVRGIDFPHPPRSGAQLRSERHSRSFASAFLSKDGRQRRPMLPRKRER
jgi:hypothetical protein